MLRTYKTAAFAAVLAAGGLAVQHSSEAAPLGTPDARTGYADTFGNNMLKVQQRGRYRGPVVVRRSVRIRRPLGVRRAVVVRRPAYVSRRFYRPVSRFYAGPGYYYRPYRTYSSVGFGPGFGTYGYGPYYSNYYYRRPGIGAALALGTGAAVAGFLATGPAWAGTGTSAAWQQCANDYVSFDWNSGTIVTYSGAVVTCPYLR